MPSRLLLQHTWALGDAVLFTALCRDIQKAYPGRFEILVDTHYRELFANNPYASLKPANPGNVQKLKISYAGGIRAGGKIPGDRVHMLSWFHRDFNEKTGLQVPVTLPHGDLHMTAEELKPAVPGRYWMVMAGGKSDATVKIWRHSRWQQTVDALNQLGIVCVQAGASHPDHIHQPLRGVVDLLGKCKGAREFISLIANADGVICPITGAMHIAACFQKPCVVIAGGREAPFWESYTNVYKAFGPACPPVAVPHRYLHTLGLLPCCQSGGCWKHRTVALPRKDEWNRADRLCKLPVIGNRGLSSPRCMDLITVDHVLEATMSYYTDGTLPPVGQPARTYSWAIAPVAETGTLAVTPSPVLAAPPLEVMPPDQPPAVRGGPRDPELIDHPLLKGKLTVFVLCYGDHFDLAESCFNSILSTLPAARMDLRVGLNAVCDKTRALVRSLPVTKVYEGDNIGKYKKMREMFWDPECPITTSHLLWLDDDARAVSDAWASDLCRTIVANHPQGARIYGAPFVHDIQIFQTKNYNPLTWFQSAAWWRNRPLLGRGTLQPIPNGTCVRFAVGWAWAMASEMIIKADIPDQRLVFNGGDIINTAAVAQAGGHLKSWNTHKALFWCPPKEAGGRRGSWTNFPWSSAEAAAGKLRLERAKF